LVLSLSVILEELWIIGDALAALRCPDVINGKEWKNLSREGKSMEKMPSTLTDVKGSGYTAPEITKELCLFDEMGGFHKK